ncbi:DUF5655 domain-containing protein [Sphingomonas glaciei]|uniref:DUF5655 domain-containing protein n=1 Tax=Sphingomonas glaciei TaxID=2938948 RepID=A0ABY5MY41_9SPHN|nr:DUF5655 domain-containing protein [Sphingomonas glaciei]UUR09357.1 DUF5655 domain-containing protein [Sphingomonas glaciei]
MTAEDLLSGHPEALALHKKVEAAIMSIVPAKVVVLKSQVGFYRHHPFAATWRPGQYLSGETAPLILSVYLRHRDTSLRWKEIIEPGPGRFTHHLELRLLADIDLFVRARLAEAWKEAA